MNKLKLYDLRQENCGYNPERAIDHGKVTAFKDGTMLLADSDGHISVFYKTECKDEIEYIEKYPRMVGLVYRRAFFVLD